MWTCITQLERLDIPYRRRWGWRWWWTASRAGKNPSRLRITRRSQLKCRTCVQLSSTFYNWEVVVDLEVTGLKATGNQQAVGLYSARPQQAAVLAIEPQEDMATELSNSAETQ